jgi:hypothetical protein
MAKYKFDMADIDVFEENDILLTLPYGYRFYDDLVHVRGYDTISEIKQSIKRGDVIPCDCDACKNKQ